MIEMVFGPLGVVLVVKGNEPKTSRELGIRILHDADRVQGAILDKHVVELLILDGFFHIPNVQRVHCVILILGQHSNK